MYCRDGVYNIVSPLNHTKLPQTNGFRYVIVVCSNNNNNNNRERENVSS